MASTNVLTAAPPTDADEEMGERLTGKRTLQVETSAAGGTALAGRRRGPTALLLNPKAPAFVPHGRPRRKPSRWGRGFTDDSDTDFSSSDDFLEPFPLGRDRPWLAENLDDSDQPVKPGLSKDFTAQMGYDGNAGAPGPGTSMDAPVPEFLRARAVQQ